MASLSIVRNRRELILSILDRRGDAGVDELSEALEVSPVTVRRDLDYLDRKGSLVRKRGGAKSVAADRSVGAEAAGGCADAPEKDLAEKDDANSEEKARIAERAAELVKDGDILFTNSGSTVLAFISALKGKRVKVITNNAAAIGLKRDPGTELIILGGEYREQSRSLVGEFALNTVKDIFAGNTFLGVNGLSLERGLMTSVHQECGINQAMIANTREKVVVLADSSKLGAVSNFVSSPLSSVDIVVTDSKCPERIRIELEALGIEVILA